MAAKRAIALALIISIITITFVASVQGASATNYNVTVKFAVSGFTDYTSSIMTIDGTTYTVSTLSWKTFEWMSGSTHTITAYRSVKGTDYPNKNYTFASWSNGNGLTTNSGTFTVPSCGVTVTANYAVATHFATFAVNGLTSYSGNILRIDGKTYTVSNLAGKLFAWDVGTVHTVEAITPVVNTESPKKTYTFQSWSSGSGLSGTLGTITMPNNDISITANYGSPTYNVTFAINGLYGYSGSIIKIDGVTQTVSDLGGKIFAWNAGTTHTIEAVTPVVNTEYPKETFNFSGWTNGGSGLIGKSGTFTVPSHNQQITMNYFKASAQVTFATSGLGNIPSSQTVLTVDGHAYNVWQVPDINNGLDWMITSTHSVTAANMVTDWDGVQYIFQGWTNGNGLTANSGTLTTPNGDVVVTAVYAAAATPTVTPTPIPTSTKPSTTLTISVVNSTADRGAQVTISGALTSGSCGLQCKTITLSYFDGASWCVIGHVTTGCGGVYSYSWTIPQDVVNGQYPLKAEFAGDCSYQGTSAMTGTLGNGGSLFVVPEVGGALGALGACIGSTLVYGKLRSKRGGKA